MMARAMATLMRLNEDASTPSRGQLSLGCYNVGMPIYEYICDDCKTPFEKLVLNKQQETPARSVPAKRPRSSFPSSLHPTAQPTAPRPSPPPPFPAAEAAVVAAPSASTKPP